MVRVPKRQADGLQFIVQQAQKPMGGCYHDHVLRPTNWQLLCRGGEGAAERLGDSPTACIGIKLPEMAQVELHVQRHGARLH